MSRKDRQTGVGTSGKTKFRACSRDMVGKQQIEIWGLFKTKWVSDVTVEGK